MKNNKIIIIIAIALVLASISPATADGVTFQNNFTQAMVNTFNQLTEKTDEYFKEVIEKFNDMGNHWSDVTVGKLVDLGVIDGYEDGTFKPDDKVTRAEFSKMVYTSANPDKIEGNSFTDTSNHWAKDYINTLVEIGGIDKAEYGDSYNPNKNITRLEMAKMVVRTWGLKDNAQEKAGIKTSFNDDLDIKDKDKGYIIIASENEIITGYPDNTFKPNGEATRAEASTIIVNALTHIEKGTINSVVEYNEDINYNLASGGTYTFANMNKKHFYYSDPKDENRLYRISLDGGSKEKVSNLKEVTGIQLTKDFIYLSYWNDELEAQKTGKIDYSGNLLKTFNTDAYIPIQATEEKVYVLSSDILYEIDIDSDKMEVLIEDCDGFNIDYTNNEMYYALNKGIYKTELGKSSGRKITNTGFLTFMWMFEGKIYYKDYPNDDIIFEFDPVTKNKIKHELDNDISEILVKDNYMYYSKDFYEELYIKNLDTGKEQIIHNGGSGPLNIMGNEILFKEGILGLRGNRIFYYDIEKKEVIEFNAEI